MPVNEPPSGFTPSPRTARRPAPCGGSPPRPAAATRQGRSWGMALLVVAWLSWWLRDS